MKSRADVVIVGGGISGAAIAYNLAKKGVKHIVVLEKSYQGSGSTGRCGAGIRQQWGTEMNCRLSKLSNEYFEKAKEELEYHGDLEFKQGGYLILASTDSELELFRRNVRLQNKLGIRSQLISNEEAKEIVPFLVTDEIVGATYHEKDGHLNPFTTLDAFVRAAKRMGVTYLTHTEVTKINVQKGRVVGVETTAGNIATDTVVNAAGGYSKVVADLAGVAIPTYSERHQILVTTPINPILKPMVMSFSKNIYTQQVPHGSIIMGRSDASEPRDLNNRSSWQFLDEMAKTVTSLLPPLERVRVVRAWAGQYNLTPDKQPILGEVPDVKGFYLAVGFSGHGFMFAPATGILLSEMILKEKLTIDVSALGLNRFSKGELIIEPSVV
ncbi:MULTISPECIES: FAD-binding oxidoreductase [unclassified Fusibacter]|uniref:NAD(P)/FAD-dependent oxidoreductase n=1 Tax=unclassified Fusibacter TaxID=2624464 RepID=UPI00101300B8|nr:MULTISPECIES: FAD-binding oxidoreductase [unclassified Fusibacter]MCK8059576.1 FAD-binding oxidoreductase [Fusibacter sp. A2]NPE21377.1 FAD-binding oxidoreductase [Fusibacter sp. A1]RXV61793.1 FAD-binding oxidoreductase [Fusibacter sp. A1]